jgi:hypothetical protein
MLSKLNVSLKGSNFCSLEDRGSNLMTVLKGLSENNFHKYLQTLKRSCNMYKLVSQMYLKVSYAHTCTHTPQNQFSYFIIRCRIVTTTVTLSVTSGSVSGNNFKISPLRRYNLMFCGCHDSRNRLRKMMVDINSYFCKHCGYYNMN